MIHFTWLLLTRSRRWLAPALLVAFWVSIAMNPMGGGSSVQRAAGMLPCYVIAGCWLSIIIGSIDDDAHRELVTAAVGSRTRLHVLRNFTALAIMVVFATTMSLLGLLLFPRPSGAVERLTATFGLAWSGVLLGIAFGAPLHRPVIRHGATALAVALALLLGFFLFPPMQSILRGTDTNNTRGIPALFIISALLAASSIRLSAFAAERRRT